MKKYVIPSIVVMPMIMEPFLDVSVIYGRDAQDPTFEGSSEVTGSVWDE